MVQAYWSVGKLIVNAQGGEHKAAYGDNLLNEISHRLTAEFGKGFDTSNLRRIRQFYLSFPICGTVCHKLSWSHIRHLIKVSNADAREYYAEQAAKGCWSVRCDSSHKGNKIKANHNRVRFVHRRCVGVIHLTKVIKSKQITTISIYLSAFLCRRPIFMAAIFSPITFSMPRAESAEVCHHLCDKRLKGGSYKHFRDMEAIVLFKKLKSQNTKPNILFICP